MVRSQWMKDTEQSITSLNRRLVAIEAEIPNRAEWAGTMERAISECQIAQHDLANQVEAIGKSLKEMIAHFSEKHTSHGVEISSLQERTAATECRLVEIDTAKMIIEPGEEVPDGMAPNDFLAVRVVELAMTRFELTPDDIAVFWLPPTVTQEQAIQIGAAFAQVINKQFRHFVFVRGGVDIQVYRGLPEEGQRGKTQFGIVS